MQLAQAVVNELGRYGDGMRFSRDGYDAHYRSIDMLDMGRNPREAVIAIITKMMAARADDAASTKVSAIDSARTMTTSRTTTTARSNKSRSSH